MAYEATAVIGSNGEVILPAEIREKLEVKGGDALRFHLSDAGELTVVPEKRRSIFEHLDELKLPSIGRPVTREDIDAAIGEAIEERQRRLKAQRGR